MPASTRQVVPGRARVRVFVHVMCSDRLTGELGIYYSEDVSARVPLLPRHVRLLLALLLWDESARHRGPDAAHDPIAARLFGEPRPAPLSPAMLGARYGKVPPTSSPISDKSVRTYVSELRARVEAAVRALRLQHGTGQLEVPEVISSDGGYRLGPAGLQVYRSQAD